MSIRISFMSHKQNISTRVQGIGCIFICLDQFTFFGSNRNTELEAEEKMQEVWLSLFSHLSISSVVVPFTWRWIAFVKISEDSWNDVERYLYENNAKVANEKNCRKQIRRIIPKTQQHNRLPYRNCSDHGPTASTQTIFPDGKAKFQDSKIVH